MEKQLSHDRPHDNIGFILERLAIEIDYRPIECEVVFVNPSYVEDLRDSSGKVELK